MTTTTTEVPEHLRVDFDIYDPALAAPVDVMQEKIAELAARGPVVYSTAYGGHWLVTGYDEVHTVLRDAETFSSYPNNLVDAGAGKFIPLELDPPEHTVQGSLAWSITHLSANPGQRRRLIDDPASIPDAVEEILRIALVEIHRRIPDYRLHPGKSPVSHSSQVRGVV